MMIGAIVVLIIYQKPTSSPAKPPQYLSIPFSTILPSDRFPNKENLKFPFIVEFLDYECPPCKKQEINITSFLDSRKNVQRIIRHYPLKMHPNALKAAILSEQSRLNGNFDEAHKLLISNQLSSDLLNQISSKIDVNSKYLDIAKKNVTIDQKDAQKIGIRSTPSLLVCLSETQILQIHSLAQLKEILK